MNEIANIDPKNVLVSGDMHGDWQATKRMLNRQLDTFPDTQVILQCGDFGFWPNIMPSFLSGLAEVLRERNVILYWADGNHEDHETLDKFPDAVSAIDAHGFIRHVKRGEVVTIAGQRVLFFGGAISVDRDWRTEGYDYFRREIPSQVEWYKAAEVGKVDIVVSHDVPDFSAPTYTKRDANYWPKDAIAESATHRAALSQLALTVEPRLWFAGHHHQRSTTVHRPNDVATRYEVLNCNGAPFNDWCTQFDLSAPAVQYDDQVLMQELIDGYWLSEEDDEKEHGGHANIEG